MPRRSKKQDRLCAERNASVKPIEKIWIKRMKSEMDDSHRIYYKKKKTTIEITCSLTGKQEIFYRDEENPFAGKKVMQQDPAHNDYGKCPICQRSGKFISPGKAKKKDIDRVYYTLYDQWEEDGIVARHIEAGRKYENPYSDYKGPHNIREEITEYARTWLKIGKDPQIDYNKYDYYIGKSFWDYKNLYGLANINIEDRNARQLNIFALQRGQWKYAMDFWYREKGFTPKNITDLDFLKRYVKYPEMELMTKCGMGILAHNLIEGYDIKKYKGDKIWEQYGVTKEHWNYIRQKNLGINAVKMFQQNDVNGYGCSIEQIEWINQNIKLYIDWTALDLMTPTKLINYIKKKEKEEKFAGNGEVCLMYMDYLHAMRDMEYDMTNTVYLFPKNLKAKHDEAIHRRSVQQNEKKKREKNAQFKNIAKNYKKLYKTYAYEEGEFFIRPASSAGEIITEGKELHHCVGGDSYLSNHNRGNSYILLMRRRKSPDIAYCTIEIQGTRIRQWYQRNDKKPDKEIIQPWLDSYVEHLEKVKDMKEKKNGADNIKLAAG